ncbi:MAG: SWI/SNF chromatin-remodeling complex subunit [Cirrosporium novae-zelandiae]|nr:MAG: SWI/SNF chromatin-remodeling complex subunit [Cirrosporium novae-zelandiae]
MPSPNSISLQPSGLPQSIIANGVPSVGQVGGLPQEPSPLLTTQENKSEGDGRTNSLNKAKENAKAVLAASVSKPGPALNEQSSTGPVQQPQATTNNSAGSSSSSNDSGTGHGRKRSRSGTRLSHPSTDLPHRKRETPVDQIYLEQYVHRQLLYSAGMTEQNWKMDELRRSKDNELAFYKSLMPRRQADPASIFGPGYSGFGNGVTDMGNRGSRLLYPLDRRRAGGRRAKELRIPKKDIFAQAEQLEELVPVRLEIEWEKIKLRDTFTWNLHDRVTPMDLFAEQLIEDFQVPSEAVAPLAQQVRQNLSEQIQEYYPQIFIDEGVLVEPYFAYKNDEMRILIKLNVTIGQHTLVDQFEWELNNPLNSPEEFAAQTARDLGLSGEFTTAIAHSIREQCQAFTKSLYITGHPFDGRPVEDPDLKEAFLPSPIPSPFRPYQSHKDFRPFLYELNEADLERTELSFSRDQRRQKRSVNRRGGPALPDLKDRQKVIRSLIVSSVLPGAASNLEESRIFKYSASTGRSKRATTGQNHDGDDSEEESDSDESTPNSPSVSHISQGTARTRGMRGAASAAQAALRANFGHSATPEPSSLHHHEIRATRRGRDYREESFVEEIPSLVVKLKINKEKYKQWWRDYKTRPKLAQSYPSTSYPPSQRSLSATPQQGTPAPGSMPPPPTTPAMQNQPNPLPNSGGDRQPSTPSGPIPNPTLGAIDAPFPPPPNAPPIPSWLATSINDLRIKYPDDAFEGTMRYTAVDLTTGQPIANAATLPGQAPPNAKHQFLPRIRCRDCPGKLYNPGPEYGLDNFEVHLKNRHHRERVTQRLRGFH